MSEIVKTYFCIAVGSALGGMGRFWLSCLIEQRMGDKFPWGTLLVNISGSFLIGLFSSFTDPAGRFPVPPNFRIFFMVGICGGYTTFSAFSLQTLKLAQNGEWLSSGGYILLSTTLCLIGVWLGHTLGQLWNR